MSARRLVVESDGGEICGIDRLLSAYFNHFSAFATFGFRENYSRDSDRRFWLFNGADSG